MKKQIIVSSVIATAILGATAILSVAKAESKAETGKIIAANSTLDIKNPIINNKGTETVYVMADENGNVKSKFIGSTIYNGAEELPFTMKATYYLDGVEISAKDLAGKSGHVKIVLNYDSTAKYNGRFIPFLALTTINLNHSKFSNIKLTNGKIFNENNSAYTIIGYALTGLGKNLGTDFLPDTFILEADTTDFKLVDTYTIFTNDILADIDLSELSRLEELKNAIYQLEDATNKLINGATDLSNGIAKTIDGTKTIYNGSKDLLAGFKKLEPYSTELTNGARAIIQNTLVGTDDYPGLNLRIANPENAQLLAAIQAQGIGFPITTDNYIESIEAIEQLAPSMAYDLENAKNLLKFAIGTIGYTQGVAKISEGATNLSNGIGTLLDGENQLYQGSITLRDGLVTFKTSGIDKLVSFANNDLENFIRNLRASVTAAGSYKSFGGVEAKSVKFIVKTPSI